MKWSRKTPFCFRENKLHYNGKKSIINGSYTHDIVQTRILGWI